MPVAGPLLKLAIRRNIATWLPIFAIVAMVALTQVGTLSREVIDHDETTFMLMGAEVAAGHLPYVRMFDLKPPLMFFLLGGVEATFGKSLFAVRVVGDLLLFVTALLIFCASRRYAGRPAALGGALIYVAIASLDFGQPTTTELPAMAFLIGALWLLTSTSVSLSAAGGAGLLISLAVLTRSNLVVVAIAVGGLLLAADLRKWQAVSRRAWIVYTLAGLVPPVALTVVYAGAGESAALKLAMIDVPLAYSGQLSSSEVLAKHAELLLDWVKRAPAILLPAAGLAVTGLLLLIRRLAGKASSLAEWRTVLPCAFVSGTALSLLGGGAVYDHYWLQLLPFVSFLAALTLDATLRWHRATAVFGAALVALPVGKALAASAPATIALAQGARYDEHYDIATAAHHIADSGIARPRIWCWSKHMVRWYLDIPPLSPAGTHPDNLGRPAIIRTLAAAGYVSNDEVGRLMRDLPDFVVTDEAEVGLRWMRATGKPVDRWLADNYYLEAYFGDVLIYRRIS